MTEAVQPFRLPRPLLPQGGVEILTGMSQTFGLGTTRPSSGPTYPAGGYRMPAPADVDDEMQELRQTIAALSARVAALESVVEIVDEPSFEVALQQARRFFSHPGITAYPDELAETLGFSVSLAIEVCEALVQEGLVASPRSS